jgi:hypothetical protein
VAAGDVDGNGSDEIFVAAPYADGPGEARLSCGEAYVIALEDTDGDGLLDIADPCPNDVDCDDDQYSDHVEMYVGTDALDACPDGANDDAWPPDINNSTVVNITDVVAFRAKMNYCASEASYDPRFDLNQQVSGGCAPPEKAVNIADITLYRPILNTSCTNP